MKKITIAVLAVVMLAVAVTVLYVYFNPTYTLAGQVIDADNQQAVAGAAVVVDSKRATTDASGRFALPLGRTHEGDITITANDYDANSVSLSSAAKKSSGLISATLTQTFKVTPNVQIEAARKWNYLKYGQYDKVWELINQSEDSLVPQAKYTSSLSSSMAAVSNAGAQVGDQTVASEVSLPSWKEPNTGKTYKDVKELQITQSYTILGQTVNKNFVSHWALDDGVWTFFVNPKDPSYPAD